jgi:hypothetical protein
MQLTKLKETRYTKDECIAVPSKSSAQESDCLLLLVCMVSVTIYWHLRIYPSIYPKMEWSLRRERRITGYSFIINAVSYRSSIPNTVIVIIILIVLRTQF